MKFDIGNILYIVITLVVVIVGLLGKKKKQVGRGTGEPEVQARPGFLENLEKAFTLGQPEPGLANFHEYEEDSHVEEMTEELFSAVGSEPLSLLEEYELLLKERHGGQLPEGLLSGSDSQTEQLEIVNLDDEQGTDFLKAISDFDAGTAILYSAIIDRLDY